MNTAGLAVLCTVCKFTMQKLHREKFWRKNFHQCCPLAKLVKTFSWRKLLIIWGRDHLLLGWGWSKFPAMLSQKILNFRWSEVHSEALYNIIAYRMSERLFSYNNWLSHCNMNSFCGWIMCVGAGAGEGKGRGRRQSPPAPGTRESGDQLVILQPYTKVLLFMMMTSTFTFVLTYYYCTYRHKLALDHGCQINKIPREAQCSKVLASSSKAQSGLGMRLERSTKELAKKPWPDPIPILVLMSNVNPSYCIFDIGNNIRNSSIE